MNHIRNRIRKAMEWLKDNGLFSSNHAIAKSMGYNPSMVSQVITGRSNVSERFVRSLCGICPSLNFDWIWNGNGEMILESKSRQPNPEPQHTQSDRFSYILADMAEIMRNMTSMMAPLSIRMERMERRIEEQAREIDRLREQLAERDNAATSRKK